ncbi:hypothetical protein GA0070618_0703 [Micromonospora echinospora]|uniref:Uncharacterized protein n=1 Tax=Micromonospora echinospora TaxID=1877 RepID=A0A1C4UW79_MICEC|nr:hypothetical protein GA0070618_0703 [Micromonospora echinospora]
MDRRHRPFLLVERRPGGSGITSLLRRRRVFGDATGGRRRYHPRRPHPDADCRNGLGRTTECGGFARCVVTGGGARAQVRGRRLVREPRRPRPDRLHVPLTLAGDSRTITTGYQDLRIPLAANRIDRTTPAELQPDFWHGASSTVHIEEIRFEQDACSHGQDKSPLPHRDRRRGAGRRPRPGRGHPADLDFRSAGTIGRGQLPVRVNSATPIDPAVRTHILAYPDDADDRTAVPVYPPRGHDRLGTVPRLLASAAASQLELGHRGRAQASLPGCRHLRHRRF